jgi:hypothetical protein
MWNASCLNGWSCGNIAISAKDAASFYFDLLSPASPGASTFISPYAKFQVGQEQFCAFTKSCCLSACLLLAYLLPTSVPACLLVACLLICCLLACLLTCLCACLCACVPAFLPACLPARSLLARAFLDGTDAAFYQRIVGRLTHALWIRHFYSAYF